VLAPPSQLTGGGGKQTTFSRGGCLSTAFETIQHRWASPSSLFGFCTTPPRGSCASKCAHEYTYGLNPPNHHRGSAALAPWHDMIQWWILCRQAQKITVARLPSSMGSDCFLDHATGQPTRRHQRRADSCLRGGSKLPPLPIATLQPD